MANFQPFVGTITMISDFMTGPNGEETGCKIMVMET